MYAATCSTLRQKKLVRRVLAKRGELPWSPLEECVRPRLFDFNLTKCCRKQASLAKFWSNYFV